jgi:hypothetical protein
MYRSHDRQGMPALPPSIRKEYDSSGSLAS